MTVRVNRIEKYWECCKVESEDGNWLQ